MRYGLQIKRARKKLKIIQEDLTDSGISRVHICDIESGKSKLVAVKAMKMYEKLLYFSLLQDCKIEINFDGLFLSESEYHYIKKCYNELFSIIHKKKVSEDRLYKLLNDYRHKDLKRLKFFWLTTIADGFNKLGNYKESYRYYFDALSTIKYDLNELNYALYERSILSFHNVSAKIGRASCLIDLYDDLLKYLEYNNLQVNRSIYYNLSLLEKRLGNNEKSLELIDKYNHLHANMPLSKKINVQIIRASLLISLDNYTEAMNIYSFILPKINLETDSNRFIEACSEIVNCIVANNLEYQAILSLCEELILKLISTRSNKAANTSKAYTYLGKIYESREMKADAYKAYLKSFKTFENDLEYEFLVLIENSYNCYRLNNEIDKLARHFLNVNYEILENDDKLFYCRILSIFMFDCNSLDKETKNLLIGIKI